MKASGRDRPQSPHHKPGAQLFGEGHEETGKRPHTQINLRMLRLQFVHMLLDHFDPLFQREKRSFLVIVGHSNDKTVSKLQRAPDNILMTKCHRIECTRINADSVLHRVTFSLFSRSRFAIALVFIIPRIFDTLN